MPKKSKRTRKEFTDWTDEDWKEWGEEFGKRMEKWGENFGKRMEQKSKEREWRERWFWSWGLLGPLIASIFGIIGLVILVWIIKFINLPLGNNFLSALSNFILGNLYWFFAASLFFGYNNYFARRMRKTYWIVSPITTAICVVIALWIAILTLNFINTFAALKVIAYTASILYSLMFILFVLFIVFGYVLIAVKKVFIDLLKL
jgi:hypothetical protein